MGPGFRPEIGCGAKCPARRVWQGSGFAANQTNAMLATSSGGDKTPVKGNPLRLSGITVYVEEFSICGREMKCFFIWLSRDYFPCTQCFFGVPAWGWYHYPRRALHAVETLDARRSRRCIRRFCAVSEFALCGLNLPSAGTHATPVPNRAHSGSHAETGGESAERRMQGCKVFKSLHPYSLAPVNTSTIARRIFLK